LSAAGGQTGPVVFHWMSAAFLPVIFSIDFNSGSWTSRSVSTLGRQHTSLFEDFP